LCNSNLITVFQDRKRRSMTIDSSRMRREESILVVEEKTALIRTDRNCPSGTELVELDYANICLNTNGQSRMTSQFTFLLTVLFLCY
jgi:hypothetical protein